MSLLLSIWNVLKGKFKIIIILIHHQLTSFITGLIIQNSQKVHTNWNGFYYFGTYDSICVQHNESQKAFRVLICSTLKANQQLSSSSSYFVISYFIINSFSSFNLYMWVMSHQQQIQVFLNLKNKLRILNKKFF